LIQDFDRGSPLRKISNERAFAQSIALGNRTGKMEAKSKGIPSKLQLLCESAVYHASNYTMENVGLRSTERI
jgi:hypothetical protein